MDLEDKIRKHYAWIRGEEDGEKLILRDSDLRGSDLSGSDLSYSDLSYSDLSYSDLSGSNLRNSNISYSDLSGSNISYSNLSYSDLRGSDLSGSNLRDSDLSGSNLRNSNLRNSDLRNSNLSGSNLAKAILDEKEEIRKGVKLGQPITGWKKCKGGVLVRLEIPRGAIVFSINNNKCRTDKAIVREIIGANRAYSMHKHFSYYVGDVIEIFDFNCEYNLECAAGIHFFRTKEEAEKY